MTSTNHPEQDHAASAARPASWSGCVGMGGRDRSVRVVAIIGMRTQELVDRYGDSATSVAQERITALAAGNDQPGMNVALRVLSALESLLEGKRR